MQLKGTDPDIQTLISRIKKKVLDLQPSFQRGEIWPIEKKKVLVDTILRDWHVPPIHIVVVKETGKQEVLDGQQRLSAIRDFVANKFSINGHTEPFSNEIVSLDGLYYKDLPPVARNQFDNYSIRQFLISDYSLGEPGELFHRLNQQARLTPAEKRNAFFGPVRNQIKGLVKYMERRGLNSTVLGFTNSRMAYDDVLSKALLYIERESLAEKVSESSVTARYREKGEFSEEHEASVKSAILIFAEAARRVPKGTKFNKATVLSWLIFFYRNQEVVSLEKAAEYLRLFESARTYAKNKESTDLIDYRGGVKAFYEEFGLFLAVFNDRASSRVADVSSVITRDAVLNLLFYKYLSFTSQGVSASSCFSLLEQDHIESFISRSFSEVRAVNAKAYTEEIVVFWGRWDAQSEI